MRRTQLQLDDATHARLRRLSYERGRSIASLVRDSLDQYLGTSQALKKAGPGAFLFVGAGRRRGKKPSIKVSENHDKALAEAIEARWKGRRRGRRHK